MNTERFNMILKLYPEEMQVAVRKKPLHIHISEGASIPAHIRRNLHLEPLSDAEKLGTVDRRYYLDTDGWIIDKTTKGKVVRNFKTAGKPNMESINGQAIWNGNVSRYSRNRLKKFLTDYFVPNITRQLPAKLFAKEHTYCHIEFIFYRELFSLIRPLAGVQDIDNHAYPYVKAFMDTLVSLGTVPGDHPDWIRGYYARYVHEPDHNERRLEIKIHFCTNTQRIS